MKDRRQMYRLVVTSSDESYSSQESSPEVKEEGVYEFDENATCKRIELSPQDKDNHSSKCLTESPHFSNLKLPMIIEEEAETTYQGIPALDLEDDDSPFFLVNEGPSAFGDSCEHSQLMNKLWNKSK